MKLTRPVTDDELADYADGGLTESRRAEIAAWLLQQPDKRAEVARLQALNEALKGLGAKVLEEPVPERLRAVLRQAADADADRAAPTRAAPAVMRRSVWPRFLEAAAVLLVFVLGGGVGWFANGILDPGPDKIDRLLADAGYAFQFYAGDRDYAIEFPPDRAQDFSALSSRLFEIDIQPPDLSPSGYRYRGARITPTGGYTGAVFFFENEQQQDIGVLFWPAEFTQSLEQVSSRDIAGLSSWYWFTKGYGFAVLGPEGSGELGTIADELSRFYQDLLQEG